MKKIIFINILFLCLSQYINGQNTFFIGQKTYHSTENSILKSSKDFAGYDLTILIAKNGEAGFFVVSTEVMTPVRIKGNLSIYLDNGELITCIDKGKYDMVDDIATTVYYLTSAEINKLKESNIQKVRFSLKTTQGKYSSSTEEGSYSATNFIKEKKFNSSLKLEEVSYYKNDFPSLVNELFNE
jgi:hypothetical protein